MARRWSKHSMSFFIPSNFLFLFICHFLIWAMIVHKLKKNYEMRDKAFIFWARIEKSKFKSFSLKTKFQLSLFKIQFFFWNADVVQCCIGSVKHWKLQFENERNIVLRRLKKASSFWEAFPVNSNAIDQREIFCFFYFIFCEPNEMKKKEHKRFNRQTQSTKLMFPQWKFKSFLKSVKRKDKIFKRFSFFPPKSYCVFKSMKNNAQNCSKFFNSFSIQFALFKIPWYKKTMKKRIFIKLSF